MLLSCAAIVPLLHKFFNSLSGDICIILLNVVVVDVVFVIITVTMDGILQNLDCSIKALISENSLRNGVGGSLTVTVA